MCSKLEIPTDSALAATRLPISYQCQGVIAGGDWRGRWRRGKGSGGVVALRRRAEVPVFDEPGEVAAEVGVVLVVRPVCHVNGLGRPVLSHPVHDLLLGFV